jgi:hypothetical protein
MDKPTHQQKAASILVVVILLAMVGWLCLLATSALQTNGSVSPVGEFPKLHAWWAILKWWIGDSQTIANTFAGLLIIISVGGQFLARLHTNMRSIVAICLLCLAGIAAAILFLSNGNDPALEIFKEFRSVVERPKDQVAADVNTVISATIVWLIGIMAVQLGISLKNVDGALKKLIS